MIRVTTITLAENSKNLFIIILYFRKLSIIQNFSNNLLNIKTCILNSLHIFKWKKHTPKIDVCYKKSNSIQFQNKEIKLFQLSSNLSRKVFFFLFNTFTSFKTNESFDCNISSVCFSNLFYVFSNCLFSVFSFNISLI